METICLDTDTNRTARVAISPSLAAHVGLTPHQQGFQSGGCALPSFFWSLRSESAFPAMRSRTVLTDSTFREIVVQWPPGKSTPNTYLRSMLTLSCTGRPQASSSTCKCKNSIGSCCDVQFMPFADKSGCQASTLQITFGARLSKSASFSKQKKQFSGQDGCGGAWFL